MPQTDLTHPEDLGAPPRPRLRIVFAEGVKLGPGKVDLLEAVERTGSISAAGRELGMSYRRAWLLIQATNELFKWPVVLAATGGAHGGGATLTDHGRALIAAYRRVEAATQAAVDSEFASFGAAALKRAATAPSD
jgi:molybdate transport system regulatory protein